MVLLWLILVLDFGRPDWYNVISDFRLYNIIYLRQRTICCSLRLCPADGAVVQVKLICPCEEESWLVICHVLKRWSVLCSNQERGSSCSRKFLMLLNFIPYITLHSGILGFTITADGGQLCLAWKTDFQVTITIIMGPNEAFRGYLLCNFHWSRWGHTRHCGAPELPGAFILVEKLVKTNVSCINHNFSIYRNVKAWCIQTLFMNTMVAFSPHALTLEEGRFSCCC